jgi:ankyrin repeat protein
MLKELPPTLDATYTRILERIRPAVREDALTLLRWLAYAARPVTLAELQTAVTIRPEDDEVDFEDEGDFRDSLGILAGLVVFSHDADSTEDGEDTEQDRASLETKDLTPGACVRLAHFSVKEYLESARISGSPARFFRLEAGACHRFLAQSCLTYLMSYSNSGEKISPEVDLDKFHLLNYAADKWYQHSRLQSGDDVSREVALLECEDARNDWLEIDLPGALHRTARYFPSICYAVHLHLPRVVKKLLEAGQDANAVGPRYEPLLVVATENEDQTSVELLLAHGADVDMAPTNRGGNALWCAASRSLPLTKLLVDNGADVNFACRYGTALSAACLGRDQSIVNFLLGNGARVDVVAESGSTALTSASHRGRTEVVELLTARGADVNHPNAHNMPLTAAASRCLTDVMAVLVAAGADVNAQGGSALLQALRIGHEPTVAFLEASGAKNPTLEQLNEALIEVCCSPHHRYFYPNRENATNMLLDRGADANADNSRALLIELEPGDEHTVALLEAAGAKLTRNHALIKSCDVHNFSRDLLIEVRGDQHHQNLASAFQMLLDRGADGNAADFNFQDLPDSVA